ncbi:MAG TPA: cyclopropane-fatty-acyl-phospholipid synthase family protein [Oleiagrimonas sp.]|nr:cyclopropane-fatty-acyl-phospholipid synthase family protein [Oleiagrimonas sp.]
MNAAATPSACADHRAFGSLDRLLRRQLASRMTALRQGWLRLVDSEGTLEFGDADARPDLQVRIEVRDPTFYRALAANGSVGAGEAWMDDAWHCDNLVGLIRVLVLNRDLLDGMETGMARLGGWVMKVIHAARPNTRNGARRNIAKHYDLGNDFFRTFLCSDMMYSSALWRDGADTLDMASTRKLERICQWLQLKHGDRIVEVGTGWGGFALYAARQYGCHVTTTTISRQQYELTRELVAAAGMEDRVAVLNEDYRDLAGTFDKLVSIEMIEAIGAAQLATFFAKIGQLLKPDGLAMVQAITIEDHRYRQALKSVDFIKRHVFPGCFIPSIDAMLKAKTQASDLALIRQQDFGQSYARTLEAWRQRFMAHRDAIREQGFDHRFERMWEFYLAYCEGGFRERSIGVSHLLFARPGWRPTEAT